MAMNTTPKLKGSTTGKFDQDWEGANGAAFVYQDGGAGVGQAHNREDAVTVAGTPESFTWPAGSRPTKIIVTAYNPSAVDTYVWVVFDAPDAVTAAAWLNGATGAAVDSQRFLVLPVETASTIAAIPHFGMPKEFNFTDGLSNMYYKSVTGTVAIHVEAS